ncbi:vacuolar-type H+-ATPase subunit I/STV1 [Pedobacter africanus]|uniref:Vacuolar-type H+-ATPase subunit I/STV1 n=1 Tax=Pedobacter africanus TaxID=151894 RepID=A0ACC6KUC9_9SPHI|nr:hypothetical protein [Pedobacter africanus]MDR6782968.1 vacuolar-type H+-ATPase subunit I/STV1 [Pedobacter africanus]
MSEEPVNESFGILRSLKKLIFVDSNETTDPELKPGVTTPVPETKSKENVTTATQTDLTQNTAELPATDLKQMKIKVLEILEQMNQPGIDFFEVWNAAAEMGSVDAGSIKAAFTSLKYVDKTLDKNKLIRSAQYYSTELKQVIDKETEQKQQQKQNIEKNLVAEKANLSDEIQLLEKNIAELQLKLSTKQKDLKEINVRYTPQLQDIDHKIAIGNTAVTEVINDIKNALSIIESNIN